MTITKRCPICGATFQTANTGYVYCGPECGRVAMRKQRLASYYRHKNDRQSKPHQAPECEFDQWFARYLDLGKELHRPGMRFKGDHSPEVKAIEEQIRAAREAMKAAMEAL